MGLVLEVYPQADFMNKVLELANSIAAQSSTAVQKAKEMMNEFDETVGRQHKINHEAFSFGRLMGSHDQREGMTAFTEKRKPKFEGLN
jgi:enoyl-CoA hydratase/carnithine racemase